MDIQVSGPVGLIEIQAMKDGAVITLKKIVDPVGSVSIEIDDPDVLSIHSDGTLHLGVIAGDPSRPELTHTKSEIDQSGRQPRAVTPRWESELLADRFAGTATLGENHG